MCPTTGSYNVELSSFDCGVDLMIHHKQIEYSKKKMGCDFYG